MSAEAAGEERPATSWSQRVARAVQELASAQKPGPGVPAYMRWVNRALARRVAAGAYVAGLQPNTVTGLSLLWSVMGMALLLVAPASWWLGVVVAVFLAAAFAFDSADGQLARLSQLAGPRGEWLDHVVDALRTPALHIAVAVAVWLQFENGVLAALALVISVVMSAQFMSQMLAEQLIRRAGGRGPRRGGNRQSWLLLPTDPGVWAWIFVLWGFPHVFGVVYAVLVALNLVHIGASLLRRYRDLSALQGAA